jgi:hypothetical protein
LTIFDHWSGLKMGSSTPIPNEANFTLPSRDVAEAPYFAQATLDFINKDRLTNSWKKKWRKFRGNNNKISEEAALNKFYREKLSRSQRDDVEQEAKTNCENDGWTGWDQPRDWEYHWAHANYRYVWGLQHIHQEMCHLKLMQDNYVGATFFHFTHFYDVTDANGDITARNADIGGLAAPSYSSDLGFRGAFTTWDHPTNGQRTALFVQLGMPPHPPLKDGNYTSAHEFGHFLHLAHPNPPGGSNEQATHDANDGQCVMNYKQDSQHLCGGCALRIRGWGFMRCDGLLGYSKLNPSNQGDPPENQNIHDRNIGGVLDNLYATLT